MTVLRPYETKPALGFNRTFSSKLSSLTTRNKETGAFRW